MDTSSTRGLTPLVGRERELRSLQAALGAAGEGQGGVALITGEPGIGKTRLALELMRQARDDGWQVFFGRAYEAEGAPPYLPFSEALREYVRGCPQDELEAQLGAGAAEVAVVSRDVLGRLPRLADSPSLSPEHERFRLWESVCDFLLTVARSATSGVLLVLDDLQWADRASLLLWQHLARRSAEGRFLTVGAYRRADLTSGHPLADVLADLNRERLYDRLVLRALSAEESTRLVQCLCGHEPTPGVAETLHRETEGNPYFLTELVRHLQSEGYELADPSTAPDGWGIPDGVRQVIARRLSRVSPQAALLLRVAAVAGDGFSFDLIEAAIDLQPNQLLDALDEALEANLIREAGDRYQFAHHLIRETLYRELNAARRGRLHGQIAEAMERLYVVYPEPHLAELAHHLFQAGGAEPTGKAVGYARRAAQRAVHLLAYEDAVSLLELALNGSRRLSLSNEDRCDLLLELGDARRRAGQYQAALEAFLEAAAAAREAGGGERLARASLGYEDALLAAGIPRQGPADPSISLQREALQCLGDQPSALRARVLAALGRALHFVGVRDEAARVTDEAVELARTVSDNGALASALNVKSIVMWGPDDPHGRLAVATELKLSAEAAGDEELVVEGHMWRLRSLVELGDISTARAESEGYLQRAEALREPQYRALALTWKASLAYLRGAVAESDELIQQALTISRAVQSPNLNYLVTAWRIDAARDLGRIELLGELRADAEMIASQVPAWRLVLTLIDCDLGRAEAARQRFKEITTGDYLGMLRHWLGLRFASRLAEICAALDETSEADRLYPLLLPYAEHYVGGDICLGSVSRYLGLLAATRKSWPEAEEHFRSALRLNGVIGHSIQVAHTQRDYAVMLLGRGRGDDARYARGYLDQATAAYQELGARAHAQRAAALALQAKPANPAAQLARPAGLTEREIEVLQLIAAGKTNAEIADRLVLSVRTVERHITNAYGKIDARGKADATAFVLKHLGS